VTKDLLAKLERAERPLGADWNCMTMRHNRFCFLALFLTCAMVPCFAHHMAVVVNKENHVEDLASAHLAKIVQSEIKQWPNGKNIVLVFHNASNGELLTLERLTKSSAAKVKSFMTEHPSSVILVDSDAEVIQRVETTPGAIGFVEFHTIDENVNVVKVDGKLPSEAGYLPH
jgi:ABC-type phosphate transport system substrate-binding protein